jgi:RNase P subunit RPR2
MSDIKTLHIPVTTTNKTIKTEKVKKPRVITEEDAWVLEKEDYDSSHQYDILFNEKKSDTHITVHKKGYEYYDYLRKLAQQQIHQKINGYHNQDVEKGLLDPTEFIDMPTVMQLLKESNMSCMYCKEGVQVLYQLVREPKQWSLDRIDNAFGHNKNNVVIACLKCNLKRRCIYHEKFVFTKNLNIVKQDSGEPS